MDGYALSTVDQIYEAPFYVVESLKSLAGRAPSDIETLPTVQAIYHNRRSVYVTTGAPVPHGFTTVVPIEQISKEESDKGAFIRVNEGTNV